MHWTTALEHVYNELYLPWPFLGLHRRVLLSASADRPGQLSGLVWGSYDNISGSPCSYATEVEGMRNYIRSFILSS